MHSLCSGEGLGWNSHTLSRSLPAWSQGSTATVAPPQPLPGAVSLDDPRNQGELPGDQTGSGSYRGSRDGV